MKAVSKVEYVVDSLLVMLQNDLRLVVESGCPTHGCGAGGNFTICLMCMIACEVAGALSATSPAPSMQLTRAFIRRVGDLAHDRRYARHAGLLFHLFRNGIGHSFLPKQTAGLKAVAFRNGKCVDWLRDTKEGQGRMISERVTLHLCVNRRGPQPSLDVVAEILYLDVTRALEAFRGELPKRDQAGLLAFSKAFDEWVRLNRQIRNRKDDLTEYELKVLNG